MMLSVLGAVAVGVTLGAAGYWLGRRSQPAGSPAEIRDPAAVDDFVASLAAFGEQVSPVWSAQIESSRQQMEAAVNGLVGKFARIVEFDVDDGHVAWRGIALREWLTAFRVPFSTKAGMSRATRPFRTADSPAKLRIAAAMLSGVARTGRTARSAVISQERSTKTPMTMRRSRSSSRAISRPAETAAGLTTCMSRLARPVPGDRPLETIP